MFSSTHWVGHRVVRGVAFSEICLLLQYIELRLSSRYVASKVFVLV